MGEALTYVSKRKIFENTNLIPKIGKGNVKKTIVNTVVFFPSGKSAQRKAFLLEVTGSHACFGVEQRNCSFSPPRRRRAVEKSPGNEVAAMLEAMNAVNRRFSAPSTRLPQVSPPSHPLILWTSAEHDCGRV